MTIKSKNGEMFHIRLDLIDHRSFPEKIIYESGDYVTTMDDFRVAMSKWQSAAETWLSTILQ